MWLRRRESLKAEMGKVLLDSEERSMNFLIILVLRYMTFMLALFLIGVVMYYFFDMKDRYPI